MSDQINEKGESFLKLYRANESYISRYVLALCPNFSAAEDIMQETVLVMWRKFDQFVPESNFLAWGMQIARLNVLSYQRKQKPSNRSWDRVWFGSPWRQLLHTYDRRQGESNSSKQS